MKDPATAAAELEELLEQRLGLGRRDGFVSEAINVVVATAEELGFRIAPACQGALTTVADRLPEPQFERAELRAHLQEAERVR